MDARKFGRFAVQCSITFSGDHIVGEGIVIDLSKRGWKATVVISSQSVRPGTYLKLRLYLPDQAAPIDVDWAAVRWAKGQEFGLEFLMMGWEEEERLRRFVDTLRQEPSVTDRIIQTVAENPECQLADVLHACPDLTWNQIFSEVDHLSRSGQVRLRQKSAGVYTLSLPGN